jgi:hypothetical protein
MYCILNRMLNVKCILILGIYVQYMTVMTLTPQNLNKLELVQYCVKSMYIYTYSTVLFSYIHTEGPVIEIFNCLFPRV